MPKQFDRSAAGLKLSDTEKRQLRNGPADLHAAAEQLTASAKAACQASLTEAGTPGECGLQCHQHAKFLPEDFVFYCDEAYCPVTAMRVARNALADMVQEISEK